MRKSIFAIVAITAMLASCQNAATETPVTIGADSTLVDSTDCITPDSCAAVNSTSVTDTTVSK